MNKLRQLKTPANNKKNFKSWIFKFGLLIFILFVAIYLPARNIYLSSRATIQASKQLMTAAKQENLDQVQKALSQTQNSVRNLENSLNLMFWIEYIPFFGGYYSDIKHLVKASGYELDAAGKIVNDIVPYKNELGLTGQTTTGQDRIAQIVKILDKMLPSFDKITPDLRKARQEVEDINTEKYPEKFRSQVLRKRLEEAKNFIIAFDIIASDNRAAIEVLPEALGGLKPKSYLLIFQNDKELRATGGFMTAYAFLYLDKGHLSTTSSDDIYRLDEKLLKVCLNKICPLTPPDPIVKYLPETSGKPRLAWSMRDSNLSPDLPTSAADFERMYTLLGEGTNFDGIITIDTQVVEELINLTGPIDIFGTNYSSKTDKRCNCPNVIYELEHYAEIASQGEADRKAIVGTLMQQLLAKVLGTSPSRLPDFIDTGVKLANGKHVMFYMHDQKIQQALSKLNWTGEIKNAEGDYLHINDSNFAGGKSNMYVDEKVTYNIKIDSEGNAKNEVTVEYKNPQPYNTWLNAILRDYVRLYVPLGSKLVFSKGSDDPISVVEDKKLNKTYFEAFITVRPQNARLLNFEYSLPNKVTGKTYSLLIQKQPGSKNHHYIVKVNGSKKSEFNLTEDKQLNLSF